MAGLARRRVIHWFDGIFVYVVPGSIYKIRAPK